ncbi:uncharacterized protein E5676_scaffold228G00580 [Cucumis melo var. makuwa]|uniref:GAG-pre-integrase domain-containing protein n=1 Tax=Cucumis melo var. makuwa TaxID=1194695 RepID=A0A5A7THY1_CUCMM|nr:uncharacterized protein E6C27_scaffold125G002230 [Cucumis melo var. makuwa]TYK20361.1 uncharacterized protein E5676_scaffold228G00580 [Cucumis melo var. makuwa]
MDSKETQTTTENATKEEETNPRAKCVSPNPFATSEIVIDPNWYIGSRATNDVTKKSSGLTNSVEYSVLKSIFCVPDIIKNLDKASGEILLKGTLKDDLYHLKNAGLMVATELNHSRSVKKQLMHKNKKTSTFILSGGKNLVSINVVVSKAVWHKCLGHPSSKILNSL